MTDYQTIQAGSTDPRGFTLIKRADGSAITTGTVNQFLKALTGANAGKWWRASDNTWQAAETANAMTYESADAEWTLYLTASPFGQGVAFVEYAKESASLHVPQSRRLKADYTPTSDSSGKASLTAGSIDFSQLSSGMRLSIGSAYLVLTGVTSPVSAATDYAVAGYNAGVRYYFSPTTSLYAWTDGTYWYITSTVPGAALPAGYFKTAAAATVLGPYTLQGTATGTPAIAAHGNASLGSFQPDISPATSSSQTAILAAVNAITTNTARGKLILPPLLFRPSSGSTTYEIDLNIYAIGGQLEAPDAAPTLHARNAAGTSLDAGLTSTTGTLVTTGRYKFSYTIASTDTAQEVFFDASWAVGGTGFGVSASIEVTDAEAIATLTAIKAKTDQLTFTVAGHVDATAGTVVLSGSSSTGNPAPVNADFAIGADLYWTQSVTATGVSSAGWTTMVFSIKASPESDAATSTDADALVLVRVTNGGAGTDGLLVLNGAPATDATQASVTVGGITPDTSVTWAIQASAMNLASSPSDSPYVWELTRWTGTRKERLGTGAVTITQSNLQTETSP